MYFYFVFFLMSFLVVEREALITSKRFIGENNGDNEAENFYYSYGFSDEFVILTF